MEARLKKKTTTGNNLCVGMCFPCKVEKLSNKKLRIVKGKLSRCWCVRTKRGSWPKSGDDIYISWSWLTKCNVLPCMARVCIRGVWVLEIRNIFCWGFIVQRCCLLKSWVFHEFPFFSLFFLKDSTLSSTVESNGVAQTLSEKKHVFFSVHALPITRTTAYQTVVYIRQKTKTYSNFNIHLLNIYTWLIVNSYFFIFHWFIFLLAKNNKNRDDICQRFVSPLVTSKHR